MLRGLYKHILDDPKPPMGMNIIEIKDHHVTLKLYQHADVEGVFPENNGLKDEWEDKDQVYSFDATIYAPKGQQPVGTTDIQKAWVLRIVKRFKAREGDGLHKDEGTRSLLIEGSGTDAMFHTVSEMTYDMFREHAEAASKEKTEASEASLASTGTSASM